MYIFHLVQMYKSLADYRHWYSNNSYDIWLGVEAFEDLTDEPCLSPTASNLRSINKASFGRVQRGIEAASGFVQKVAAVAWDPDFTCRTKSSNQSLADEIKANTQQTMITQCFLHSSKNRSVVVTGYNFALVTSDFVVRKFRFYASLILKYCFKKCYNNIVALFPHQHVECTCTCF